MCVSDPDFASCGVVSCCTDPVACLLCWNDHGLLGFFAVFVVCVSVVVVVCVCVCLSVRACVCVCVRARARVCVRVRV